MTIYFVTSPDIVLELLVVSHQSEQVLQRYSLSWLQNVLFRYVTTTTTEPIFLVLHVYLSRPITTSSSSSVTIAATLLIPDLQSQSVVTYCVIEFWLSMRIIVMCSFTARCTIVHSAVLRSHVVCLSVLRWWIMIT